jgi:hypothetical protein
VATATFFLFILSFSYVHNHIAYIHSHPFVEASLLFFKACFAQCEEPPWGAEPGFELGPAIQQASALPTEPRCTRQQNISGTVVKSLLLLVSGEKSIIKLFPVYPAFINFALVMKTR